MCGGRVCACVEGECVHVLRVEYEELLCVVFYALYPPAEGYPWAAQTGWCGKRLALHPSRRLTPVLSRERERKMKYTASCPP